MGVTDGPACSRCGAQVLWVRREGGQSWHPPLVVLGRVITLNAKGEACITDSYTRHQCDPADVKAYEAHQERLAQARQAEADRAHDRAEERRLVAEEQAAWRKERASMQDEAWRVAKKVACPKCGAEKKKRCENLNTRAGRTGNGPQHKYTAWPHPERRLAAEKET